GSGKKTVVLWAIQKNSESACADCGFRNLGLCRLNLGLCRLCFQKYRLACALELVLSELARAFRKLKMIFGSTSVAALLFMTKNKRKVTE
ncbi:hypothetical protein ACJX0J_029129, partial [Zea mays]